MPVPEMKDIDFQKGQGLVPAIIQHWKTGQVLMLGYMDEAAFFESRTLGEVVFFSRSRGQRWRKGEISGHRLQIKNISTDCDRDAFLIHVEPLGPVCHLGTTSCFQNSLIPSNHETEQEKEKEGILETLMNIVQSRALAPPEASYTARLLAAGPTRVAQKVGEEGVELAIAAQSEDRQAIASEAADLLFHLAVLLKCKNVSLPEIAEILESRRKP